MTEERAKALEEVMKGAFSITLNMNDTFAFACADAEDMSSDDFEIMVPLIAKYGQPALTAYASVKRDKDPIHCPCGHDSEPFQKAREEVRALKKSHEDFMTD